MRTSTRCSRGAPVGRTRLAGVVKIMLTLFLLYLISPNLSAQTCTTCLPVTPGHITIDGSPCDWNSSNLAGVAIRQYTPDPFGNGVLDNQFTEGSKDFFQASALRWSIGQTKAKNDIANSAVAIIDNTLYFAGDRTTNTGDAQIGFWFYLNGTGPHTRADGTQDFAPEHAVGDILVLADFTNGGTNATTTVYRWVGSGGNVPNTNGTLQTVDCPNAIVAENNGASYPHPNEFSFDDPCYAPNEFYEGAIPLSCIQNATGNICFSSYLLETRSSQSITASLDDFVAGAFTVAPIAVLTGGTITCNNPTVTLSTTGSSAGTYVIRGPAPASTIVSGPVSVGGVYTLVVTNSTGCTSSATASVSVNNTAPTAALAGGTITCTNPTVTLSTAGSSSGAGFTQVIRGPSPSTTIISGPVSVGGVYTLVVTNTANGCTASATASVSVNNTAPNAALQGGTITCANPTVTLGTVGSSSGAGFTQVITGPSPSSTVVSGPVSVGGVYTLVVTNTANGCTSSATASVSVNTTAPNAALQGGTITCANPTVTLGTVGSSSGAGFTQVITGPSPSSTVVSGPVSVGGVYTLVVTNTANGCTSSATASVSVNTTAPNAALQGGTITCANPTVTLGTVGSSSGAGFTQVIRGPSPSTTIISGPVSVGGVYTLVVTNTANGCTASATASVSVNNTAVTAILVGGTITCTNPTVTLSTAGSSSGAGITQTITGPSPANTVISGPVSVGGVYTLVVSNATTGCTASATASVSVNNTAPNAALQGGTITCANPTVTLGTVGSSSGAGFTQVITGPSPSSTVVSGPVSVGGVYTLVVTNTANGCTSSATASVSVNTTAPNAALQGGTITCANPTVTLGTVGSSSGAGFTQVIRGPSPSTTIISGPVSVGGVYTLVVTNTANGCTASATASVSVNNTAVTAILVGGTITCTNPTVTLSTAGSSSGAGITQTITGPSPANTVISGPVSVGGVYTLVVSNATTGCTASATASVSVNNTAPNAALQGGTITCANPTVTLGTVGSSSGAGFTQVITGPSPSSTVVSGPVSVGGVYTLVVTNTANGCTSSATASVSVNTTAPNAALQGGTITCANPTVTLGTVGSSSGAGFTQVIRGPSPSTTIISGPVSVGGVYTLIVTNTANGCTASATASVSVDATAPNAALQGGTITCANPTVTLGTVGSSSGAGFTQVIRGPSPSTTIISGPVSVGGVYTLVVTNTATGCTASATASVSVNNTAPNAALQGGTITCANPTVTLGTVGSSSGAGFTQVIRGPSPSTTIISGPVSVGGVYTLVVTNTANGCTSSATASVSVNTTAPTAMLAGGTILCGNTTVNLSVAGSSTGGNITYSLSGPGTIVNATSATPTVNAVGTYTLTVTNTTNGCTATATASVTKQNCNILVCSYTQGFWGNKNGLKLMQTSGILNTSITIGVAGHSVIIPSVSTNPNVATLINNIMPGGSTPDGLDAGNFTIGTTAFGDHYLTKQGKINNVLLSQTITLALNSRLNSGLLATIPLTPCMLIDDSAHTFDQGILTYMATHGYPTTVAGLLKLANDILGGAVTGGPSYSEINGAVTWVNEAFDECKMFGGACTAPIVSARTIRTGTIGEINTVEETTVAGLQVAAYPNPFNDVVKFTIQSKVSGQAQLIIYNTLGQRVKTIYNGFIQANKSQVVEYRSASPAQGNLFYTFTINGKQVTGKLLKVGN